jgi:2-methylisocitrate lyase-like PEP mutase family enzyme
MTSTADKAATLQALHAAPALLKVVNIWDVASAKAVAGLEGTTALATASHSIAASFGYPDGEQIPVDLMIDAVGRIAAATELPVSADLEAGYGNAGETTRKAIDAGIVGANLEDQMKPLADAVAAVEAVVKAAEQAGVPFVLNARTDAYALGKGRDRADILADAIERGKAFLDAGASVVFVPARLDEASVAALVDAFGPRKLTMIGVPGTLPLPRLEELGVARVSYGPITQRIALTALAEFAEGVIGGSGDLPGNIRPLN